jgi:hypothetical protein
MTEYEEIETEQPRESGYNDVTAPETAYEPGVETYKPGTDPYKS